MTQNLMVLGTYSVDSPYGGGKYVGFHLFRRLSRKFNVKYFSLIESDKTPNEISITPSFVNLHTPQNIEQAKIQWEYEKKQKQGLHDVIQINHWQMNSKFVDEIQKNISESDLIILEHPYLSNLVQSINSGKPVIYHAHNIEYFQKQSILNAELLEQVKQAEKLACEISAQIWTASEKEKNSLKELYDIEAEKIKILPHGVDLSLNPFLENKERVETKKQVGLSSKTTFVFTGSWHPPNLEALEFITSELAPLGDDFQFLIVGGVKDQFLSEHPEKNVPKNVKLFGNLSDSEKITVYKMSDFALNPMFSGAGTNLKILEYMAVGLPIISTDFGVRGIKLSKDTNICLKNQLVSAVKDLKNSSYPQSASIKENYEIVVLNYNYDLIAKRCMNFIDELLNPVDERLDIFRNVPEELEKIGIHQNDSIIETVSKEIEAMIK